MLHILELDQAFTGLANLMVFLNFCSDRPLLPR